MHVAHAWRICGHSRHCSRLCDAIRHGLPLGTKPINNSQKLRCAFLRSGGLLPGSTCAKWFAGSQLSRACVDRSGPFGLLHPALGGAGAQLNAGGHCMPLHQPRRRTQAVRQARGAPQWLATRAQQAAGTLSQLWVMSVVVQAPPPEPAVAAPRRCKSKVAVFDYVTGAARALDAGRHAEVRMCDEREVACERGRALASKRHPCMAQPPAPGAASHATTQGLAVTLRGEVWVGALVDDTVQVYSLGQPAALGNLQQVTRQRSIRCRMRCRVQHLPPLLLTCWAE